MIELVALDIGGTVVQEHGAVYEALGAAVGANGRRPSADDVRLWMGAGKREEIDEIRHEDDPNTIFRMED